MSARAELFRRVAGSFVDEERANKLIDDLLHEEAEKIRKLSSEEYNHPKLFVCQDALNRAVNLIDPYVKGE